MICDITNFGTPLSGQLVWNGNNTTRNETASSSRQQSAEANPANTRLELEDEA
jgi:hypothetical protein